MTAAHQKKKNKTKNIKLRNELSRVQSDGDRSGARRPALIAGNTESEDKHDAARKLQTVDGAFLPSVPLGNES